MAGSGADPLRASLVPLGTAQIIGLGVQQRIQRFLNRFSNQISKLAPKLGFVDLNDFTELRIRCITSYGVVLLSGFGFLSIPN